MDSPIQDLQNKLEALKAVFVSRLPDKVQQIESALDDSLETVQGLAHKLAGSAGTYGFSHIGHMARNLELACHLLTEQGKKPSDDELKQINKLVSMLREGMKAKPDDFLTQAGVDVAEVPQTTIREIYDKREKNIILVDDDVDQASILERLLTNFGYSVRTLDHPSNYMMR